MNDSYTFSFAVSPLARVKVSISHTKRRARPPPPPPPPPPRCSAAGIGQQPERVFRVRSSCAFLSVDNSSQAPGKAPAECVRWCRQETSRCSHVSAENTDKLRAATFTRGREREVKQASHVAAAGCGSACVCVYVSQTV